MRDDGDAFDPMQWSPATTDECDECGQVADPVELEANGGVCGECQILEEPVAGFDTGKGWI